MDGAAHRTVTVADTGSIVRRYLYFTAYYFTATVLLAAGALKIHDPSPLLGTLEVLSFINNSVTLIIAAILPVIEITIGILLLTGKYIRLTVISAAGLFWFFFAFSVYGSTAGLDADCGCFGNVIASDFGAGMILRNLSFAVISTLLFISLKKKKNE